MYFVNPQTQHIVSNVLKVLLEQYGTYYQAVRTYREKGKVKQEVIHSGEHQTEASG